MILLLPDPGRNVKDRYYYHTLAKKDGIKRPGPNTLNKYQDYSNARIDTVDSDFTEKLGEVNSFINSQTDSNNCFHGQREYTCVHEKGISILTISSNS